jgi:predicted MFS family arabinose efflux permease
MMRPKLPSRFLPPLLFLTSALQLTDNQVLPLLLKGLGERVWPHVGDDVAYLLVGYPLGAAIGPLLIASRFPHLRGRPVILAALLTLGAAAALFACEPPFAVALGLRTLAGAASGVLSYTLLIEAIAAGHLAVTMMTAGFLFAYVAGIPVGAKVEAWLGPGHLFGSLAAIALVLAVIGSMILRPPTPTPRKTPKPFRAFLVHGAHLNGLLTSILVGAALAGPVALFPSALQEAGRAQLTQDEVGTLYFIAGLGPLAALPMASVFLRTFGRRRVAIAGALALGPLLLLMPWSSEGFSTGGALLFLALLVETLRRTALQGHLGSLPAEEDRARYLSLRNVCVQVSIAGGIAVATLMSRVVGLQASCGIAATLAAVSALLVPEHPNGDSRGSERPA